MNFSKFFLTATILFVAASAVAFGKRGGEKKLPPSMQKVRVQIQVVADSSNFLQASLEVPAGTSARDLMDRLFKMSYVDMTHRFVNGIAGFVISPKEKKFWRLDIDGKASEVGIAEIKINKPMQIRWVRAEIK
jgi:hypothetical protein